MCKPSVAQAAAVLMLIVSLLTAGCAHPGSETSPGSTQTAAPAQQPPQATAPPVDSAEEKAVAEWLKQQVRPLSATRAGHGFADLQFLKETLKDVEVVGLGEATHGTAEFFTMKHRLLEFLVTEMGYRVFAMEAPYGQGWAVDQYVSTGKGTPEEVVRGLGYDVWSTREVADLVRWMRAYNEAAPADRQVRFVGFDIQLPRSVAIWLEDYGKKALPDQWPGYETAVRQTAVQVSAGERGSDLMNDHLSKLQELEALLKARRDQLAVMTTPAEADQAIYAATHLVRSLDTQRAVAVTESIAARDRYMAQTLLELQAQFGPGTRVVAWAHNGHVSSQDIWMGTHLKKALGDRYYAMGFAFNQGGFQAKNARYLMTEYKVGPAPEGWYEWYLDRAGLGLSLVDLRAAKAVPAVHKWVETARPLRSIGALYDDGHPLAAGFHSQRPLSVFDGLIYVPVTTAAQPL